VRRCGIPIKKKRRRLLRGVEAVIDKDLTSSVLADRRRRALLIILTAVPQCCLNYGTREPARAGRRDL
jgi:carbamate kinase